MTSSDSSGFSRRALLRTTAAAGAGAAATVIHPGTASAAAPANLIDHEQQQPSAAPRSRGHIPTPAEYFGTAIGTDGFLAQWDKMVPYFELIGARSDRVKYEVIGKTTRGYPYVLLTISSPKNLANLDKLVDINTRLSDPRGLSEASAKKLATQGKPFYYVQAGIHSTEVGNSQAAIEWAYRLATEQSDYIEKILDNLVILLQPCQNPDGLVLVNDYFAATAGTSYSRSYPDLYNKYTGHDDNRDWIMLTQIESKYNVSILNRYRPQVFQDSHGASSGSPRLFTPPYLSPYDPNIDTILVQETDTVGLAMQRGLTAAGMKGNGWGSEYDYWSPSRQYCVYHGSARILTEAASASNLAYPQVGSKPLGQQTTDINFIEPYDSKTWTLRNIIDWVSQAFYSGLETVAYDTYNWLFNSYRVGVKAVTRTSPYAYVIPAGQRDPQAVYDALEIFHLGAVEISQAQAAFTADGKQYPAGSYVIYLQQPYGGFAKTLLEVQDYPQLLQYPGGPPQRPYDTTAQTLPMLLGFEADLITTSFSAHTKLLSSVKPPAVVTPSAPPKGGAYAIGPESYGVFRIVAALQKHGIPTFRAAAEFTDSGRTFPAGTFLVPPSTAARQLLQDQSKATGIPVSTLRAVPSVAGDQLKPGTRIGLLKPPDNMPSGWLMWTFEQYGVDYSVVSAADYADLAGKYDAIIVPEGVSRNSIVNGLNAKNYPPDWAWAFGVGTTGWNQLHDFVTGGGTLVTFGSGTATAKSLFSLPIASVLPSGSNSNFYCPGSLLSQEFDTTNPVAWGVPADNPVWFVSDDAYKLTGTSTYPVEVVAKYPDTGDQLQSGWLIGGENLNGAVNGLSWTVGDGYVVTFGNEIGFRTWNRSEQRVLFNAAYHGPSTKLTAAQFQRLGQ
ncbi:M14 family zinc carboxypeptidase [Actinacidiphila sp. ITFR-21]|uniref:M14 family zinc carboxypeptidase n=1 Tax=Actinacidiphila sp. ITFR-21 TaxID=3075199 RepID=UPI002889482D|nr:M14 family zinc carboxypeptidase [Streptomyces sp. ITFR-21]WNI16031.1 M14 family zinc carboxypeptidase [Streptomyces sp. ITFR-21]